MHKLYTNKLFLTAFSLFVIIGLMSNSSGRANVFGQAVTGAPGDSNKTCASSGCHSSGAFSPSPILLITDKDGNEVTNYRPGETYDINLSIETTGNPVEFGFQMVALASDISPVNQWENIGDNVQLVTLGDRDYIEHNSPSSENTFSARWTAPNAGTGDVNFYYSVNAVNGNGSPSGDGGANASFTLNETLSSTSDYQNVNINIFPNPTTDFLTINGLNKDFTYNVLDRLGKIQLKGSGSKESTLNTEELTAGLYFLNVEIDGNTITKKVIKK